MMTLRMIVLLLNDIMTMMIAYMLNDIMTIAFIHLLRLLCSHSILSI